MCMQMVNETRVKCTLHSKLAAVRNTDCVLIDQLQFRHCKYRHKFAQSLQ